MKHKLIILAVVLLSGCGTFSHLQETYYVKEVSNNGSTQTEPHLFVQVVPSAESSHLPLIYYSRKWVGPYSILFSAHSKTDICTHFLLHAFKLTSENTLIEQKKYSKPKKLDLCGSKLGTRNRHHMFRYQLDDSFKFVKDREIELEVMFERPDGAGVKTILLRGKGEEEKNKSSLWDAYMGV